MEHQQTLFGSCISAGIPRNNFNQLSWAIDNENIKIFNYNIHQINTLNETNNGVAVGVRRDINYKLIDNFESDMLGVSIETSLGPVHIITAFIPPRCPYLHYPDFYKILKNKEPVYILGDLNARHEILGHNNRNIRGELLAKLINRGHAQHLGPQFSTYLTYRSATSPDIVLGNNKIFHNTFISPGKILTFSDHNYIVLTISTSPIQIPIKERDSIRLANWEKYKNLLSTKPIYNQPQITNDELDTLTNSWTADIEDASGQSIPKTKFKTLPHFKTTHETRLLQTQYNALMVEIARHGTSYDRQIILNQLRQDIQTIHRRLYGQAWDNIIRRMDIERDPKIFWTNIKKLQGNENKSRAPYIKDHTGQKIYNDRDKEVIFRNYWKNVFKISDTENLDFDRQNDNFIRQQTIDNTDIITPHQTSDINRLNVESPAVTLNEIKSVIKTIKQKAPGKSKITKKHIINLPVNMIQNLQFIFNHALSSGYFPKIFKHAIMIFLPKPNKTPFEHINYRPISLLEVPGKIFEKLLNRRLLRLLDDRGLHNKRQHGFRPNRGTDTALAIMHETLATHRGNGMTVDLVFRDISRAFDKVWHDGLRYKLMTAQLPDTMTRILSNYLADRTATVRIGDYMGQTFQLESGVPQGGCLSPTLFNFYTHDLTDPYGNTEYIAYADDITQIIPQQSKSAARHSLQTARAIKTIDDFEYKWKIRTNRDKFKVINIGRTKTIDIILNDRTIRHSNIGTVLGLDITSNGYVKHISKRINIAKAQLTKLIRFKFLNPQNKRKIYLALVRSKLLYPTIPLHIASKHQMTRLQRVQNAATRFITNHSLLDRLTNEELHEMTDLETVNVYLHRQANDIWTKIGDNFDGETLIKFILDRDRRYNMTYKDMFPSSLHTVTDILPNALYR